MIIDLRDAFIYMMLYLQSRKSLPEPVPPPLQSVRTTSSAKLQSLTSAQAKPLPDLNKRRCLPPVQQKVPTTPAEHNLAQAQSAQSRHSQPLTEIIIPKPPAEARTARHDVSQRLHHHSQISVGELSAASAAPAPPYKPTKSYSARTSRRHVDVDGKALAHHSNESRIRCIPEHEAVAERLAEPPKSLLKTPHPPFSKRKESSEKLVNDGATVSDKSAAPQLMRRSSSRQHELRSRQHGGDLTLETIKDSFYSQRITLESLSSNEAKMMSGLLQQASLERLGSSCINNFSPVRTRKGAPGYSNQMSLDEDDGVVEHAMVSV